MPTNDFRTIANIPGANVLSQADYLALTAYLTNGNTSGIVPSNRFNKTLRQATVMGYVLAQYIMEQSGADVLDNGAPAAIVTNMLAAIQNSAKNTTFTTQPYGDQTAKAATDFFVARATSVVSGFCVDAGSTANLYACILSPPWVESTYPDGMSVRFRTTRANTGAAQLSVASTFGGIPIVRKDGSPLQAGDIESGSVSSVTYAASVNRWVFNGPVDSDYLDSPALRGVPTAPTAAPGTSTTQLATTAFTQATVGLAAAPYRSLNASQTLSFGNFLANTAAGSFSCPLNGTPTAGDGVRIFDARGSFTQFPLTLTTGGGFTYPNGATDTSLVLDVSGADVLVWFDGTTWRIY